jgi:hypothetical protein
MSRTAQHSREWWRSSIHVELPNGSTSIICACCVPARWRTWISISLFPFTGTCNRQTRSLTPSKPDLPKDWTTMQKSSRTSIRVCRRVVRCAIWSPAVNAWRSFLQLLHGKFRPWLENRRTSNRCASCQPNLSVTHVRCVDANYQHGSPDRLTIGYFKEWMNE